MHAPRLGPALCAVALAAGSCSLFSSLDDLKGGGRPSFDGGKDAKGGTGGSGKDGSTDAKSDAPGCDASVASDPKNCGECGNACAPDEVCQAGQCKACDSATTDCDLDGWLVSEGDCCDKAGACGQKPELVNPGALEISGNRIDDNCNWMTDLFDVKDTVACDSGLYSNSAVAGNYAAALGICRTTQQRPTTKKDKTWGLIQAPLARADGTPPENSPAPPIRT